MKSREMTLIAVELNFITRWAVGGLASATDTIKLPVQRNPITGSPWLPGSSVAGNLKCHFGPAGTQWLGTDPEGYEQSTGTKTLQASRLAVLGCIVGGEETEPEILHSGSTAVDSFRGAASGRTLRSYEWATPTKVIVALQHDGPSDESLLDGLRSWQPNLGRGRGTGLGQAKVAKVHVLSLDIATQAGLRVWLGDRHDWYRHPGELEGGKYRSLPGVVGAQHWESWRLQVREPLHVGSTGASKPGEAAPVLRMSSGGKAVVPGTSWKGVFRHRVEYILGALEVSEPAAQDVLGWLFGSQHRGRGMLWFGESSIALPARAKKRTHVAIDRFTGGVLDGATFSKEIVPQGETMELRWRWDGTQPPDSVRNLMLHVLRDLHDGLASVGGMGARGYGWVKAADEQIFADLRPIDTSELVRLAAESDEEKGQ